MSDKPYSHAPVIAVATITSEADMAAHINAMNESTREWTRQAARGECAWICADCSVTFPEGMPDACAHGHQSCTDIITRDKQRAKETPSCK
jgi:hypothetical protein